MTELGTAQRNISAAIVVTAQNFAGAMALPFVGRPEMTAVQVYDTIRALYPI
ncbi:MAG: hypothetical protein U0641_04985 [Anaerolineae bacterium]